ncbi:MAG: hypothetical protein WDZ90_02345 [Candidatus Paceibacterota bacterium]
MDDSYICGGEKFTYRNGYIALPLGLSGLPESIEIGGEVLQRKTEFHVSLLRVKTILEKFPNTEEQIINSFCEFVKKEDISFLHFTGEFRFAEKLAETGERKTVVAMCEVSNLRVFSDQLANELGVLISPQPTHVTLYTLQPNAGIGLNSPEDLNTLSKPVDVSDEVRQSIDIRRQ